MVLPSSSVTVTPESVTLASAKRTPSEKLMPRRRNARSSSFELDSSSPGSRWGSASTIVTSAPKDFQTLANSTPITPPPRTTTDDGTLSSFSACSLVMIRSPSISRPGSDREYDPVARTSAFDGGVRRAVDLDGVGGRQLPAALDDR